MEYAGLLSMLQDQIHFKIFGMYQRIFFLRQWQYDKKHDGMQRINSSSPKGCQWAEGFI